MPWNGPPPPETEFQRATRELREQIVELRGALEMIAQLANTAHGRAACRHSPTAAAIRSIAAETLERIRDPRK